MEFRDKPMENLMRLQEKDICKNVNALLLEGEQIVVSWKQVSWDDREFAAVRKARTLRSAATHCIALGDTARQRTNKLNVNHPRQNCRNTPTRGT